MKPVAKCLQAGQFLLAFGTIALAETVDAVQILYITI